MPNTVKVQHGSSLYLLVKQHQRGDLCLSSAKRQPRKTSRSEIIKYQRLNLDKFLNGYKMSNPSVWVFQFLFYS